MIIAWLEWSCSNVSIRVCIPYQVFQAISNFQLLEMDVGLGLGLGLGLRRCKRTEFVNVNVPMVVNVQLTLFAVLYLVRVWNFEWVWVWADPSTGGDGGISPHRSRSLLMTMHWGGMANLGLKKKRFRHVVAEIFFFGDLFFFLVARQTSLRDIPPPATGLLGMGGDIPPARKFLVLNPPLGVSQTVLTSGYGYGYTHFWVWPKYPSMAHKFLGALKIDRFSCSTMTITIIRVVFT
jgi:hypothetical protein